MDRKTAGLLGAMAGLATLGAAHTASAAMPNPAEPPQAESYADLLAPVANPVAALKADDTARAQAAAQNDILQVGYWYNGRYYAGSPYAYRDYPPPPPYYHHH